MKKLMFAVAAMAAGIAVADISSSNIVGYQQQNIAGGKLTCAAFQFTAVGADNATLANISTAGMTPGIYDTMGKAAPCIQIYNGKAYDNYYFISDADDGTERYDLTGWADGEGNLAGEVGIPSTGFWLRVPESSCSTGAMTEAGEVLSEETVTINVKAGLNLIGCPYPVALDLSKVETIGLVPGEYDTMGKAAPCIQIYNGKAYDNYYYISDADDGTERYDLVGWADGEGNIVSVVAPAGAGIWLRTEKEGSLKFNF